MEDNQESDETGYTIQEDINLDKLNDCLDKFFKEYFPEEFFDEEDDTGLHNLDLDSPPDAEEKPSLTEAEDPNVGEPGRNLDLNLPPDAEKTPPVTGAEDQNIGEPRPDVRDLDSAMGQATNDQPLLGISADAAEVLKMLKTPEHSDHEPEIDVEEELERIFDEKREKENSTVHQTGPIKVKGSELNVSDPRVEAVIDLTDETPIIIKIEKVEPEVIEIEDCLPEEVTTEINVNPTVVKTQPSVSDLHIKDNEPTTSLVEVNKSDEKASDGHANGGQIQVKNSDHSPNQEADNGIEEGELEDDVATVNTVTNDLQMAMAEPGTSLNNLWVVPNRNNKILQEIKSALLLSIAANKDFDKKILKHELGKFTRKHLSRCNRERETLDDLKRSIAKLSSKVERKLLKKKKKYMNKYNSRDKKLPISYANSNSEINLRSQTDSGSGSLSDETATSRSSQRDRINTKRRNSMSPYHQPEPCTKKCSPSKSLSPCKSKFLTRKHSLSRSPSPYKKTDKFSRSRSNSHSSSKSRSRKKSRSPSYSKSVSKVRSNSQTSKTLAVKPYDKRSPENIRHRRYKKRYSSSSSPERSTKRKRRRKYSTSSSSSSSEKSREKHSRHPLIPSSSPESTRRPSKTVSRRQKAENLPAKSSSTYISRRTYQEVRQGASIYSREAVVTTSYKEELNSFEKSVKESIKKHSSIDPLSRLDLQVYAETPHKGCENVTFDRPTGNLNHPFYIPYEDAELYRIKCQNGIQPLQALHEICVKCNWKFPTYINLASENGFNMAIELNQHRFVTSKTGQQKKLAKAETARLVLQWLKIMDIPM